MAPQAGRGLDRGGGDEGGLGEELKHVPDWGTTRPSTRGTFVCYEEFDCKEEGKKESRW